MEFVYFKSLVGITLIIALIIAFINLLNIENAEIQLSNLFAASPRTPYAR